MGWKQGRNVRGENSPVGHKSIQKECTRGKCLVSSSVS